MCGRKGVGRRPIADIWEQESLILLPWLERGIVIRRWGTHLSGRGRSKLRSPPGLGEVCVISSR